MSPISGIEAPSDLTKDAERVHVGGLALVGRHSGRGVALDVLDRAEAFAHRERQILGGNVILEIDEGRLTRRVSVELHGVEHAALRRLGRRYRERMRAARLANIPAAWAAASPCCVAVAERRAAAPRCRGTRRPIAHARLTGPARSSAEPRPSAACRAIARTDERSASLPADISTRSQRSSRPRAGRHQSGAAQVRPRIRAAVPASASPSSPSGSAIRPRARQHATAPRQATARPR